MTADVIPCTACNGSGKVPLPDHLARVLSYLRENGPSLSTKLFEDLIAAEKPSTYGMTAVNNRLVALEQLGLVERIGKKSHALIWQATRGCHWNGCDDPKSGAERRCTAPSYTEGMNLHCYDRCLHTLRQQKGG